MLTEQQKTFVAELVVNACKPTQAARKAGYLYPGQEAYRLMKLPHIATAIHIERSRLIGGELASIAVGRLKDILSDTTVPSAVTLRAIDMTLSLAGHARSAEPARDRNYGPTGAVGSISLELLTEAELMTLHDRLESQARALSLPNYHSRSA